MKHNPINVFFGALVALFLLFVGFFFGTDFDLRLARQVKAETLADSVTVSRVQPDIKFSEEFLQAFWSRQVTYSKNGVTSREYHVKGMLYGAKFNGVVSDSGKWVSCEYGFGSTSHRFTHESLKIDPNIPDWFREAFVSIADSFVKVKNFEKMITV